MTDDDLEEIGKFCAFTAIFLYAAFAIGCGLGGLAAIVYVLWRVLFT
jgi:hypothetical protein